MGSIVKRQGKTGVSYKAAVRKSGARHRYKTFSRLTDAKRWVARVELEIERGLAGASSQYTVADMLDRYERERTSRLKPKTALDQLVHIKFWRRHLGYTQLYGLGSAAIVALRERLTTQPNQKNKINRPATVNRYLETLRLILNIARNEWEWLHHDPFKKVAFLEERNKRVRFLSDSERERLLDACRRSKTPCLYDIVIVALSTGARKGEITSLKAENVDLDRNVIMLHDTKNGESRATPLHGPAREIIRQRSRRRPTGFLFAGRSGRPKIIKHAWREALRLARIDDFRFHDLRHTTASYLAMNGATLAEIAEVLGHKTLSMVKRYAHLSEAHTSSVVASMTEKMFGGQKAGPEARPV